MPVDDVPRACDIHTETALDAFTLDACARLENMVRSPDRANAESTDVLLVLALVQLLSRAGNHRD